jgi:Trypsin
MGTSPIRGLAMRTAQAIAAPMRMLLRTIVGLALLTSAPAHAIVGGGVPSAEGVGRSVITIVGSRGNFCTGALIAPKIVLTAAHCVQPGADYKIVEYGTGQPQLQDVKKVAIHPAFNMEAMTAHRATADVALLQLEAPPQGKSPAALGAPTIPIMAGSRFSIAGIGITARGDGKSGGTIRVAGLVAMGKPGTLQIRLVDPVGQGTRDGLGACTGVRRPARWPCYRRCHQLVDWPERFGGLRRHHRRHAVDALPRLDFADRETVGRGTLNTLPRLRERSARSAG